MALLSSPFNLLPSSSSRFHHPTARRGIRIGGNIVASQALSLRFFHSFCSSPSRFNLKTRLKTIRRRTRMVWEALEWWRCTLFRTIYINIMRYPCGGSSIPPCTFNIMTCLCSRTLIFMRVETVYMKKTFFLSHWIVECLSCFHSSPTTQGVGKILLGASSWEKSFCLQFNYEVRPGKDDLQWDEILLSWGICHSGALCKCLPRKLEIRFCAIYVKLFLSC